MSLKEIFCQDRAISTLLRALACDRLAHAYIFAGAEGIGKFKTAKEFGKLLLCQHRQDRDSCGQCPSCKLVEADSHPDFNHIYKELIQFTEKGKDKKTPLLLPIDVIREFLIEKVHARPSISSKKIFVVSEAEKMNRFSQNAILKVLEEPPDYCSIILLCTRLERLLPTTKSRCQIIRFGPVEQERIIAELKKTGLDNSKAVYFARLSQGSLGQACQWAQLALNDADIYNLKKQLIKSFLTYPYSNSLQFAQWLLEQTKPISATWSQLDESISKTDINRRTLKTICLIIIAALSDAMKIGFTKKNDLINSDQADLIQQLAASISPEQAAKKIELLYQATEWIEANVNEKLIFEHLLLNLCISDKVKV